MSDAEQQARVKQAQGEAICRALNAEIEKLQLPEPIEGPQWQGSRFTLHRDPALGATSLEVLWLADNGGKLGSATLHEDGTFFAEFDIIRPHPLKPKWFVEAVTAWGRGETVKAEARLLPVPE